MTYEQAIAYWFGRINYELRAPQPGDLKLDRMRSLLRLLGDPQNRFRIIHVAGSKGKGSTSAMLASILRRSGYRTGLFTSPHLTEVEERIQVDGVSITRAELTALMADIQAAADDSPNDHSALSTHHSPQAPTFFEIATALGFLHFARRRVDIAVIEVGLGGRFDSTNVCQPMVSLITSISFDHTQQLGNTLASIAMEKSGIIKPGRPVVSGTTLAEPRRVIESIAGERRAPLRELGRDFHFTYEPGRVAVQSERLPRVQVRTRRQLWPVMELGLLGQHQAENAAVAIATVEELREQGLRIDDQAVASGLAEVCWPARLEVVRRRPLVVLDCAHNVASAQALVDTLLLSFPPTRRHLIFAGSNDKDLAGMLRLLTPHFEHVYFTSYAHSLRSVPPDKLAEFLPVPDIAHTLCPTAKDAWQQACASSAPDDLICITGSVFLAGELRPLICTT